MKKKEPVIIDTAEVLRLIELINDRDISSEARTIAIGLLEKMTGQEIKNKKDMFRIAKEYEK